MQEPTEEAGEQSSNQLGYRRASIACNHCQRRKIRCVASLDVQSQCLSCIRLNKVCSFWPIDQQFIDDSPRKALLQGVFSSTASYQLSSDTLTCRYPFNISSRSRYAPCLDANAMSNAGTSFMPSGICYPGVREQEISMFHRGNQPNGYPRSTSAWSPTEPSPDLTHGTIGMGIDYATEFLFAEPLSPFGLPEPGESFTLTEMEATTRPIQHASWNGGGDIAPTAPTSFPPISGEFGGEPHRESVQTTSDAKYDDAGRNVANTYLSQISPSFGFQQF